MDDTPPGRSVPAAGRDNFRADQVIALLDDACGGPSDAVAAVQRLGLRSLLTGHAPTLTDLAARSGLSITAIRAGVDGLAQAGRIEIDGDTIIGVGGLTSTETIHTLKLPDATMHTWCALDSIGIPIAYGVDAELTTSCGHCGGEVHVRLSDGRAHAVDGIRLLCPTGPCNDVRSDFCSAANLFCSSEHLNAWRASHPGVEGQELDLSEAVKLGHAMWQQRAARHARIAL